MAESGGNRRSKRNWGSLSVALGITLLGVCFLGALGYAEATTTLETDYDELSSNCGQLSNQSVLVDAGLGMERAELNETDVQHCRNTSFEEYRQARHESMRTTPLNLRQWALFGGLGSILTVFGGGVLRQELAR
jgi:hypothetical protein